ncbi:hypothetical protein Acr_08g0007010 [Actinidia rufa]|uniref:Uncharacterized protein n=1 Tax=Actinidia rufa TaxID=165716 RepID=A0A7J0F0T3_9ERIC|nr:hypothetical protein Acr_08g0007010 [Actinidia rufa]
MKANERSARSESKEVKARLAKVSAAYPGPVTVTPGRLEIPSFGDHMLGEGFYSTSPYRYPVFLAALCGNRSIDRIGLLSGRIPTSAYPERGVAPLHLPKPAVEEAKASTYSKDSKPTWSEDRHKFLVLSMDTDDRKSKPSFHSSIRGGFRLLMKATTSKRNKEGKLGELAWAFQNGPFISYPRIDKAVKRTANKEKATSERQGKERLPMVGLPLLLLSSAGNLKIVMPGQTGTRASSSPYCVRAIKHRQKHNQILFRGPQASYCRAASVYVRRRAKSASGYIWHLSLVFAEEQRPLGLRAAKLLSENQTQEFNRKTVLPARAKPDTDLNTDEGEIPVLIDLPLVLLLDFPTEALVDYPGSILQCAIPFSHRPIQAIMNQELIPHLPLQVLFQSPLSVSGTLNDIYVVVKKE